MTQVWDNTINGFKILETGEQTVANYVWDTDAMDWVAQTKSTSAAGPSADVNVTNSSIPSTQAGAWNITSITNPVGVTGTFWQATQPVSLTNAVYSEDTPHTTGHTGMFMLALRNDSDTPTADNGDYTALKTDEAGRLKVATQPGSIAGTSGSITANAQTIFINVERASNITISMVATTLVGHNATFEYSNNSTNGTDGNWYVIQVVRSNANTVETTTGVLAATPVYGWEASVNAYKWFRVRATAHTSGTATYTLLPGVYATEPIPAVQVTATQPVSGSVTVSGTATVTPVTPTANILNSAATTNGTVIKATAGTLYHIAVSNNGAAAAYLKLHNSATVTAGTTAVALWIKLPIGDTLNFDFGVTGMRFGTGICMSITGGVADTDTTAVALGQVKVLTSFV